MFSSTPGFVVASASSTGRSETRIPVAKPPTRGGALRDGHWARLGAGFASVSSGSRGDGGRVRHHGHNRVDGRALSRPVAGQSSRRSIGRCSGRQRWERGSRGPRSGGDGGSGGIGDDKTPSTMHGPAVAAGAAGSVSLAVRDAHRSTSRQIRGTIKPPSSTRFVPLMNDDSSLAKNTAPIAISSRLPSRPSGVDAVAFAISTAGSSLASIAT
jgi:hypothetical protein